MHGLKFFWCRLWSENRFPSRLHDMNQTSQTLDNFSRLVHKFPQRQKYIVIINICVQEFVYQILPSETRLTSLFITALSTRYPQHGFCFLLLGFAHLTCRVCNICLSHVLPANGISIIQTQLNHIHLCDDFTNCTFSVHGTSAKIFTCVYSMRLEQIEFCFFCVISVLAVYQQTIS